MRVLKRRLSGKKVDKPSSPLLPVMHKYLWQYVFGHAQSACFAIKKAKPRCLSVINKRSNSFQSL